MSKQKLFGSAQLTIRTPFTRIFTLGIKRFIIKNIQVSYFLIFFAFGMGRPSQEILVK